MISFTVEGHGLFPFDMLRYDSCWPERQEDSAAIERSTRPRERQTYRVRLMSNHAAPTVERWRSFGFTVDPED